MLNKNLLIVEDEPILLSTLATLLADQVSTILLAANGQEGLKLTEKHQVDAIISDISMPVMNGLEFIKEIRARGIKAPFIFYTGFGNSDLLKEAVKYGAYDFFNKPFIEDLIETILRALNENVHDEPNYESANKEYLELLSQVKIKK